MQNFFSDLSYAARQLFKTPGLAFLAIVTLALGVGANTAIFTVIESVLLRPLPYAQANRLMYLGSTKTPGFDASSWLNYRDIRDGSRLFESVAGYDEDVAVLQHGDSSQSVLAPRVTTNLIQMLGAQPLLGRAFSKSEGETGGPAVVMLSEGLWRETFHADRNIIGQAVTVSGKPYSVVGVMPASFRFPEQMGADLAKGLWLPLQPTGEMLKDRGYHFFNIVGQLRPGVSRAQLQQELDSLTARMPRSKDDSPVTLFAFPYREVLTGPVGPPLYALFGALGLVLLIACANVSNLLIARCLGRQQEFAVRAALGAGRGRLVQQLLAEGLVLSVCGCAIGIVLARLSLTALSKLPDGTLPRVDAIAIHWTVVLALAAVAIFTTVLSSLLPALLVARAHPQAALQAGSRGLGSRTVSGKLSAWLVAGEVALSTLLLVGTGLLFHTLWNLEKSQLGFETEHVTTFSAMPANAAGFSAMTVSEATSDTKPSVATLTYLPVLERIRQIPGVEGAALATSPPLSGMHVGTSFDIVSHPANGTNKPDGSIGAISGDYARTLGTPLLRGRMITDDDVASSPFVVVVNQSLAQKYFPNSDPLQQQIDLGGKDTGMLKPYTIVGVLADQVESVGSTPQPKIMVPQQQVPVTSLFNQALLETAVNFVVKTRGDVPVATDVREVFHQTAPGFAVEGFKSMREVVDNNTFSHRLGLYLVASFAGLAIAMVIAGLYGVLSQLVSYRRREIGVRMALGATRGSVAQLILTQGSRMIATGLVAGLILAFAASRLITSFLYHVQLLDLPTYFVVAITLVAVGLVAALIPARSAASIEPMEALRTE